MKLAHLSNDDLLSALDVACIDSRRLLVRLVIHLGEVDARGLLSGTACGSLFKYCVTTLKMSEDEAYRRIAAARILRRYPKLLPWLESSAIHLTGLVELRDYLTEENHEELVKMAAGKSRRQIQAMLLGPWKSNMVWSRFPERRQGPWLTDQPIASTWVAHAHPRTDRVERVRVERCALEFGIVHSEPFGALERSLDDSFVRWELFRLRYGFERLMDVHRDLDRTPPRRVKPRCARP